MHCANWVGRGECHHGSLWGCTKLQPLHLRQAWSAARGGGGQSQGEQSQVGRGKSELGGWRANTGDGERGGSSIFVPGGSHSQSTGTAGEPRASSLLQWGNRGRLWDLTGNPISICRFRYWRGSLERIPRKWWGSSVVSTLECEHQPAGIGVCLLIAKYLMLGMESLCEYCLFWLKEVSQLFIGKHKGQNWGKGPTSVGSMNAVAIYHDW